MSKPLRSRRKLATTERTRITSYYTPEEQREIEDAATELRLSISGFVANAALKEARKINSGRKKQH